MTNEDIIKMLSVRKLAVRIPMTEQLYQSLLQYPSLTVRGGEPAMTPVEPDEPTPDDTPDDE